MKKKYFIVFEGLDGTGKTTIAKYVTKQLNGIYLKTPPKEYNHYRKIIHRSTNPYIRYLYYLSSNIFISEQIAKNHKAKFIICDRYYFTTLADFIFQRKMKKQELEFWGNLLKMNCLIPDIIFFCNCNRKIRLSRIKHRNVTTVSDNLSLEFEKTMLRTFNRVLPKSITFFLDTTKKSKEELFKYLVDHNGPLAHILK